MVARAVIAQASDRFGAGGLLGPERAGGKRASSKRRKAEEETTKHAHEELRGTTEEAAVNRE
jgi:hypothetical protein